MKSTTFAIFVSFYALAGCAAPVSHEEPSREHTSVKGIGQSLTAEDCADERDACFEENVLLGLVTCPLQYSQCLAASDEGLPAQVSAAIGDARQCASRARQCRDEAATAADSLACTETSAHCVAAVVDARIPAVVSGTAECVDGSVECIGASRSVGDLAACADTLEDCALEQATEVLPPAVGDVVEEVGQCELVLATCTVEAPTPAALTQCAEDNVACVSESLNVDLPVPPVSDALQCTETATACTLEARSLQELGGCGDGLVSCTAALAEEQLTCEQQWTACLNDNPFNFLGCAADLASCRD